MTAGQWRYALYDVLSRTQISEHMPFVVSPFTRSLPEAGTLTAALNVGDPDVQKLDPWGRCLPRRTSLVVLRDEVVVTEQIIWNRPGYQASAQKMTLSCSEPRSYFDKHRLLRPDLGYGSRKVLSFTQADAFDVFRALLADAQAATYQGMLGVGDLSVIADPSVKSGVLIDRRDVQDIADAYHGYSFAYYGQLMNDLADAVGFEWRIDSYLNGAELQRRLVLGYPHLGRGIDRDSLTLEYPGNILDYTVDDDGEGSANYVASLGAGENDAMVWGEAVNGVELAAGYPISEATAAYKDDTSGVIAGQHAAAELARLTGDVQVFSVDMVGYPNVSPGDYVRLRISDEARWRGSSVTPIERWVRATGLTITPGPKERATLAIEDPRGGP